MTKTVRWNGKEVTGWKASLITAVVIAFVVIYLPLMFFAILAVFLVSFCAALVFRSVMGRWPSWFQVEYVE